ncbi:putative MFS family arabinose efflux permease [Tumebacillus sp. BK434]|uniref:MFS transporter n=1 Tax=Tumebacillus sp. BK434 TaxID=2512169 RepID=UPI001051EF62|nr:MFS transporter [Tumebacillus sp. BK434]TCP59141.1 putative MFS family arabinose efflux permease [Tumebacillus sp. BK434]
MSKVSTDAAVSAAQQKKPGMFSVLRYRDYRLLIIGQVISTLGDAFYAVAIPWLILASGSARDLGQMLLFFGIPRIAGVVLGGMGSDKYGPRQIMLLSDFMRMIFIGLMALMAFTGHIVFWQFCVLAGGFGFFTGLFRPASFSIARDILPPEALQAGNGLNQATMQTASLLGPALAGVVVSNFESSGAMAFDALTYLISGITLFLMYTGRRVQLKGIEQAEAQAKDSSQDAAAQSEERLKFWTMLRTTRMLQVLLIVFACVNLTWGGLIEIALPALVNGPFGSGAEGYGLILTSAGCGALLGGILGGRMGGTKRRGMYALLLGMSEGLIISLVPLAGSVWLALPIFLVFGICMGISNVTFITMIQQRVPHHLLGRTMGMVQFAVLGLYPLSVLIGGYVTDVFGPAVLFPISGALLFLSFAAGLLEPEVRQPKQRT